jgi:hypothetical protein
MNEKKKEKEVEKAGTEKQERKKTILTTEKRIRGRRIR